MIGDIVAGIGIGFGIGMITMYLIAVKPLVDSMARLRYDGFRPSEPTPPRPRTVPQLNKFNLPRED